jgi:hypothetical protein
MRQCPPCAGEWADYQRVIHLARQLPPAPLPAALDAQIQALLKTSSGAQKPAGG